MIPACPCRSAASRRVSARNLQAARTLDRHGLRCTGGWQGGQHLRPQRRPQLRYFSARRWPSSNDRNTARNLVLNAGALRKFRETAAHDYARAHSELVWPFWWSQPECKGAPLVFYADTDVIWPVKCFRTEPLRLATSKTCSVASLLFHCSCDSAITRTWHVKGMHGRPPRPKTLRRGVGLEVRRAARRSLTFHRSHSSSPVHAAPRMPSRAARACHSACKNSRSSTV